MPRRVVFVLLAFPLLLAVTCCNANPNKTIPIKAAIVYEREGVKPVARTKFYLLREDLTRVAQSRGEDVGMFFTREPDTRPNSLYGVYRPVGIDEEKIRDFVVASVTTDFEGNAKFEDVPPGTYYIFGLAVTQSKSGYSFWNINIEAGQEIETVFLDQNNAYKAPSR